jgi:nicotinamide riboside transporter PnuC
MGLVLFGRRKEVGMSLADSAWLLSAIGILGAIWNIRKRKFGFVLWSISNAGWFVLAYYIPAYRPQIPLWVVFTALNIYGWFQWRKDEHKRVHEII